MPSLVPTQQSMSVTKIEPTINRSNTPVPPPLVPTSMPVFHQGKNAAGQSIMIVGGSPALQNVKTSMMTTASGGIVVQANPSLHIQLQQPQQPMNIVPPPLVTMSQTLPSTTLITTAPGSTFTPILPPNTTITTTVAANTATTLTTTTTSSNIVINSNATPTLIPTVVPVTSAIVTPVVQAPLPPPPPPPPQPVVPTVVTTTIPGSTKPVVVPRSSLFERQISVDQDACTRPDTSAPFASKQDAVKRLIRYHCMYEEQREDEEEQGDDGSFRGMAAEFPVIYQNMLNKYQLLLMQESMRHVRTTELMMVDRMLISDVKDEILQMQLNIQEYLNPSAAVVTPAELNPAGDPALLEDSKIKKEELPVFVGDRPPSAVDPMIKQEHIKTEDLVAYRHHQPGQKVAVRPSPDLFKKEQLDSFDDIESEITPSFIMKKCEGQGQKQQAAPASAPPPSLSYFNHVGGEGKSQESKGEPYDEWMCIQKELNYLDERKESSTTVATASGSSTSIKSVKSPEEEIIEKQLDDLFNPSGEDKDSRSGQVDSPLADFFNAQQQQDSGVGGSATGGSSVPSDKSVENRLEALFGGTPLHNRSSEDNSPVNEKQDDMIEHRLEALFQSGESALDNASFLHKSTTNFELMQSQMSQKRHWSASEWGEDVEDRGASTAVKRVRVEVEQQNHHHRWLLECTQQQQQHHQQVQQIQNHQQQLPPQGLDTGPHEPPSSVASTTSSSSSSSSTHHHATVQPSARHHAAAAAADLQHHLNQMHHFDGTGNPAGLNFDEDISRQVQNAIDSILNLQSNETEAALHFPLDQSFLVDSPAAPTAIQRPPSSNKRKYHHINRIDDISDCLGNALGADDHHHHGHNNHGGSAGESGDSSAVKTIIKS